jgi:hypothetical protein
MPLDPLTAALEFGRTAIDKIFPDAGESEKAKMQQLLTVFAAQAEIVKAEAASQSWLASSWRPVTMLTFVALIVARWFGFAAPELSPEEYIKLWDIVELGLGGYVIGRSVEKVAPAIADAIKGRA